MFWKGTLAGQCKEFIGQDCSKAFILSHCGPLTYTHQQSGQNSFPFSMLSPTVILCFPVIPIGHCGIFLVTSLMTCRFFCFLLRSHRHHAGCMALGSFSSPTCILALMKVPCHIDWLCMLFLGFWWCYPVVV